MKKLKYLSYLLIFALSAPILADNTVASKTTEVINAQPATQNKKQSFLHKPWVQWGGRAAAGALLAAACIKLSLLKQDAMEHNPAYVLCYKKDGEYVEFVGCEALEWEPWLWFNLVDNNIYYALETGAITAGAFTGYSLYRMLLALIPKKTQKPEQEKPQEKLTDEKKAMITKTIKFVMQYCSGGMLKGVLS